jgi:hypothetical protein
MKRAKGDGMAGGEDIPWNSYGFEIEFCTHDSTVFSFTHMHAAYFDFRPENMGLWRVETDSGNVLELVSPPLFFARLEDAHEFKQHLSAQLVDSIANGRTLGLQAQTLGSWIQAFSRTLRALLVNSRGIWWPPAPAPGTDAEVDFVYRNKSASYATPQSVLDKMTVENIDDGINIPAARLRMAMCGQSEASWDAYASNILLSRCGKFWAHGYLSQVNMPMTLEGYVRYAYQKLERQSLEHDMGATPMSDERRYRKLSTWYWRAVIKKAVDFHRSASWGSDPQAPAVPTWTVTPDIALFYVTMQKVLTGALGALGEPTQLALQARAQAFMSSQAITAESDAEDDLDNEWAEYHSHLKDLTGLWLKAALADVFATHDEGLTNEVTGKFPALLRRVDIWPAVFEHMLMSPGHPLYDLDTSTLVSKIHDVSKRLADFIEQKGYKQAPLPPRAERKFLHYADAPPWEGRYDTLYPPIARDGEGRPCVPCRYLVEHRNN